MRDVLSCGISLRVEEEDRADAGAGHDVIVERKVDCNECREKGGKTEGETPPKRGRTKARRAVNGQKQEIPMNETQRRDWVGR
jgi:hypothetical protein